jgi:hypothetical protein
MGFGESISRIYVSIVDGKFAVRSSESDPKAVKRELKSGHIIYERRYQTLEGKLKEVSFRKSDFNGKQWEELHLLLSDGADNYQVQMVFPGRYANSFLRAVKNVNFKENIILSPWQKIVDGKTKQAMYINQKSLADSVPWYYGVTPETANGLPALVPYSVPGSTEQKYSDIDRNNFFKEMIERDINPVLRQESGSAAPLEARTAQPILDAESITEPIDDLPF